MNWAKQTEETFNTWQEMQQTIWQNWLGMLQGSETMGQAQEFWQNMFDAWQKSVEQTLTAQNESFTLWLEEAGKMEGLPEAMQGFVTQGQHMMAQWQAAQSEMWQNWFDLIRKSEFNFANVPGQQEAQKAYQNWQETMQQMAETQMTWMKSWMPQTEA